MSIYNNHDEENPDCPCNDLDANWQKHVCECANEKRPKASSVDANERTGELLK